jgi:hypothetical protein
MKLPGLLLLLSGCLLHADGTNITVRIGGRLRTESDLAQTVKAHAAKTGMQFRFEGAQHRCTVDTNAQAVVSILFVQTNSTYLYAQVRRDGRVSATELTLKDHEAIRRVVAKETSEQIIGIFMDSVGRVTAETLTRREGTRSDGQTFYLKPIATGWVVHERGSWSAINDLPHRPTTPLQPTAAARSACGGFRRLTVLRAYPCVSPGGCG